VALLRPPGSFSDQALGRRLAAFLQGADDTDGVCADGRNNGQKLEDIESALATLRRAKRARNYSDERGHIESQTYEATKFDLQHLKLLSQSVEINAKSGHEGPLKPCTYLTPLGSEINLI
jgi:hypothetical protein